ncbi:hypothetical protein AGR6A_Lc70022 [Agrobacterium sp. NCPPB 925]|nr:hypothetical protein AGR6A_Lc70022 [Agrobacterium sp. NCPPB 925]
MRFTMTQPCFAASADWSNLALNTVMMGFLLPMRYVLAVVLNLAMRIRPSKVLKNSVQLDWERFEVVFAVRKARKLVLGGAKSVHPGISQMNSRNGSDRDN